MKTIDELDLSGKRVFVRVDFNVPLDGRQVTENSRITSALPTIRHAIDARARVILASHLGRPKGKPDPEYSLAPVAAELARLLDRPVRIAPDCVGKSVAALVEAMRPGEVLLLENLRFHAEEERNDREFSRQLAALADVYINDAFGTAHRAHASTVGITEFVSEVAAGFLMQREIQALSGLLDAPKKPFVAIVGGAKVSDKIPLLTNLLERVDAILVGGAMAYTLLEAQGHSVGNSRVEADKLDVAAALLAAANDKGVAVELPRDHVAASEFSEAAAAVAIDTVDIPAGLIGLDIGPRTRQAYAQRIGSAATILWNGPMGVFEWDRFAAGTMSVADAVANARGVSVVGGGDSVAALVQSGRSAEISHVSTGGGASLEFLEGRTLPGIAALEAKDA